MEERDLLQLYHGRLPANLPATANLPDGSNGNLPFSFGSLQEVRRMVDIDSEELKNIMSKSNIYTEHREFKKPKNLPPIRTYGENYLWEADLMFFTHPDLAKENEGFLYILAIIDTFTKMTWLVNLKSKDTKIITEKVNKLFVDIEKPKYLRVDGGGEFVSNLFINMCKKNNVKIFLAMEPIKCAMIERFNRTFKRILMQKMEKENSLRWIDFVSDSQEIYHNRRHSTLKMKPSEVAGNKKNKKIILRNNLKRYSIFDRIRYRKNKKQPKFKLGQFVKIFQKKGIFARGFNQNVTKEYFTIYYIDRMLSKDRYYLKDIQGDKIIGSFYEEYLVPFTPSGDDDGDVYKIDPSFKGMKRKNINRVPHIFVKWLGWPDKFNQWVPYRNVQHLLPAKEKG